MLVGDHGVHLLQWPVDDDALGPLHRPSPFASPVEAHPDGPLLHACRDLRALNLLEHGPLGASVLAQRLGLTRPAVTALTVRLAAAGNVARVSVPGDRRATGVELQPATWTAFARVYRRLGERVWAATADLTETDRSAVVAAMTAMTGAFHEVRAGLAPVRRGR